MCLQLMQLMLRNLHLLLHRLLMLLLLRLRLLRSLVRNLEGRSHLQSQHRRQTLLTDGKPASQVKDFFVLFLQQVYH